MKIVVVGCGALGSFYGAKLSVSGHEVHFLLRSDYEFVRDHGVRIHSPFGDFHVRPLCAKNPEAIGAADLVLIGLKTTANSEFAPLLTPLVGSQTAIVTLQNGLGNEERLADLFGAGRVLGGLCFVCLNRVSPGVVHHMAHGDVVLGEFRNPPRPRTREYAACFRRAGVPCEITEELEKSRWEKLVWNVPFNGLGVAGAAGYEAVIHGELTKSAVLGPCVATDILINDPRWAKLVRELMGEVVEAARHIGFQIPDSIIEDRIERTRKMGAYKASTLVDFECGRPLELESLFLEPLRRARAAGYDPPRLAALCRVLSQMNSPG